MQHQAHSPGRTRVRRDSKGPELRAWLDSRLPSISECSGVLFSAITLIISFPNLDLWFLTWISLVPLLIVVTRRPTPWRSFFLGWIFGSVFFYSSCYWLTYSMVHFGGFPSFLAFVMLIPGALILGIFPAVFAGILARLLRKWGPGALLFAPAAWSSLEWARLGITGQLWNAIGYSLAFHPSLIQSARLGGVYCVGFLIVSANAALTFALIRRTSKGVSIAVICLAVVAATILVTTNRTGSLPVVPRSEAIVIAIQPNVPMDLIKSAEDMANLNARHFEMSETALNSLPDDGVPRLLVWPESPMNFAYGADAQLREKLMNFARLHQTSILLNSQELAPNDGLYNSAVLINQAGSLVAQYDKIRLLPFGEYVPLPLWLPGASLVRGIVGDFTPGTSYRLMEVGRVRIGVFICIESAYPNIARQFAHEGADVLINISNDGYLGPTAVMRQHLANAVFRAVENGRPVVRVTNTGITANISDSGEVRDATSSFRQEVRVWRIAQATNPTSPYTKYGDLFAAGCAAFTLFALMWSFKKHNESGELTA